MAALSAGLLPSAGGAALNAACVIDPQLNHVTIGQGLPYTRLVRGKETLVRFYLSLPASIPKCGSTSRSIRVNSATLHVLNGTAPLTQTAIAAQPEAINAEVTNTAPTSRNPSIPVNSPADPKFVVPGGVLAPQNVSGTFTATFQATIRYASKGNDGVFTGERSKTFASFTPPGGTATPASRAVEGTTKALRVLVVPMGGALDAAASSAVGAGMTHLSRLFPVPDGTPNGARTGELTSNAGGLRYTVNSGVIDMTGLLDSAGKFCGTSTNFARIQTQLQGFRNAWNGVVNGVDSPQDQDADKVVAVVPADKSYPSTSTSPSGCLEGFAMTNSNESWIRAEPSMAGPLFAMEICHTFGCVPDTGTFHSLYTQADNEDPDRAYNVLDRAYIGTDRTAMRLITPWGNDNTAMEKAHYGYLLCGFGGLSTHGCPAAPATGTLTGVAATTGSAIVMYGTTDGAGGVDENETVSSMSSLGAPLTVPDSASPYRLVQKDAGGNVLGAGSAGLGIPVREAISHHGGGADSGDADIGSFNVAFPAEAGVKTIELRFNNTVLYTRTENTAPTVDVSAGGGDVIPLAVLMSTDASTASASGDKPRTPNTTKKSRKAGAGLAPPAGGLPRAKITHAAGEFGPFGSLGVGSFFAVTYIVNTGTDPAETDGVCDATQCTLREAITLANASAGLDTIEFTTAGVDAESELPTITDPVIIDGTQADGTPALIELNGGGTSGATTAGLRVGTGGGGTTIRRLAIVRFPGPGIVLQAGNNVIERNHIGVPLNGTGSGLGNSDGIRIESSDNTIGGSGAGAGNVIAHNNETGIVVASGTGNRILGNVAFDNFRLGIDLFGCDVPPGEFLCAAGPSLTPNDPNDADATGGNRRQNFPIVQTATSSASGTVVTGSLDGDVPNGSYRLEFFNSSACDSSGHGEGQNILGATTITSDGNGDIVFEESFAPEVPVGQFVTATATDPNGNTSEFSACQVTAAGGGGGDPATFEVNSANDADDGACTVLHCSLREAINATNTVPGAQTITFAVGAGHQTISPASGLPAITEAVTIDGTTQPGFSGTPIIEVAGNLTPANTLGLTVNAGPTTIRGLVVNRFPSHGIFVASTAGAGNTIQGNYTGTDVTGNEDLGNGREGIRVESSAAVIGGTTPAARNVSSGNSGHGILVFGSTNSVVQGNYAGTNAAGTAGIPNGIDGIIVDGGGNNTIGGTAAGAGNLASGNTNQGIAIAAVGAFTTSTGNVVQGNKVGTNAAGTGGIPNGINTAAGDGIRIDSASNTTVGGTAPGAANIVAFNRRGIAVFAVAGKTATGNRISQNEIHSNSDIGIDLGRNGVTANDLGSPEPFTLPDSDGGANNLQNYPVLRSVVNGTISGDLASTPDTMFTLEFFSSAACDPTGNGEGARFLGSRTVTTNSGGNASFTFAPPLVATGEFVTATATDPSGNTSEFSACRRAIASEEGTTPVTIEGTDEFPENVRAFVFADCGGRQEPILVDRAPTDTSGNSYFISFDFNPKPACAGPNGQLTLTVVTNDGFGSSAAETVTVESVNEAPAPSIATDGPFVQWDGITLHGYAFDADEQLGGGALVWTAPTLFAGEKTGFAVKLTPTPSWTPGQHTVTLRATDTPGLSATVTKTITILGDADHDGCTTGKDLNDANKNDAYQDADNDGRYNCEDAQPNVADTSFTGTATFQPDPLILPYTGVVTMTMRLLNKNVADVQPSSVRLRSIDGQDVSTDNAFKATSVAVTNTAILRATFSGPAISSWLTDRNVRDRRILVTMGGNSSTSPVWSFEGTGSTFVRRG